MPTVKPGPTSGPGTPTPHVPGITQLTAPGTAPMSTSPKPLSLESKRARIVAAKKLLNDALENDHLLAALPDHLPACTCGSVTHAISNYRELQFAQLEKAAPLSGLKLFTMGNTQAGITYIAHVPKWGLNRKFRNLDELDDWFHPAFRANALARGD